MIESIDKAALLQRLVSEVESELAQLLRAQKTTQEGATHEEARPENDKDTRALESTYLARGLADRVANLENGLASLRVMRARAFAEDDPVALGALVEIEFDEDTSAFFVAPAGGGMRLDVDGITVRVLTSQAPLGKAMIGKYLDDEVEYRTPQGARTGVVVALR